MRSFIVRSTPLFVVLVALIAPAAPLVAQQTFHDPTPGLFTQQIQESAFLAAANPNVAVQVLTFDELPLGAVASDHYASFGVTLPTTLPTAPLNPGDAEPLIRPTGPLIHAHSGDRFLGTETAQFGIAEDYTIEFSPPVVAVGFWVIDQEFNPGLMDRIQVFDDLGGLLTDVISYTNGYVTQELGVQGNMFFGYLSPTPIGSIRLIESITDGEGVGLDTLYFQPQFSATHPGTGETLFLRTGLNGAPLSDAPFDVKTTTAADTLDLLFGGAGALLTGAPVLVAQIFVTGTPLTSPFPGIAVDPFVAPIFALFDGLAAGGPLGPLQLPASGLALTGTIPAGLAGTSLLIQGFSQTSQAANGFFATTNGHELQVL